MKSVIIASHLLFILFSCGEIQYNDSSYIHNKNTQQGIKEIQTQISDNVVKIETSVGIDFLKNFYAKFYIDKYDLKFISKEKYVSKDLLHKMDSLTADPENIELDYDPFIQGQDYSNERIKNTIQFKAQDSFNIFRVTFIPFPDGDQVIIEYQLEQDQLGNIKIVNILSDDLMRLKK